MGKRPPAGARSIEPSTRGSRGAAGALDVISRALEPLTPESQARVMHAAAVFFGIDLSKPPPTKPPTPVAPEPAED
jgi:hypothetical protein